MALNKITKLTIATATSGGVAVGAYYALNKPIKIKDILGIRLLGFNGDYANKWIERATKLSKAKTDLSPELEKAKEGENAESGLNLMQWCQKNVNNKFISESDPAFLEVQEYCTSNIKENVVVALEKTWTNKKNNEKLMAIDEKTTKLSEAMAKIKAKLSADDTEKDENALKDWCTEAYEKPFKDGNDQVYLDVVEYCQEIQGQPQN